MTHVAAAAAAAAHDALAEAGLKLAMLALASIATLSFAGTVSRYLFGLPIGWVPDWTGYLLAISVFLAAPAVMRRGQHVAMDLLANLLPGAGVARALRGLVALLTLAILATLTWVVVVSASDAWRAGTLTAAGYPIPRWWLLSGIAYGFGSCAAYALRDLVGAALGRPAASAPEAGADAAGTLS